jgi:hypothetical protein
VLETQDKDVQEFLSRLKRKRMRKRIALVGGVGLLLLIVALAWWILR